MRSTTIILTLAALFCCAAPLSAGDDGADAKAKHQQKRAELKQRFDANHDGKLDEQERAALRAYISQQVKEKHPKLFAMADTNGDGQLTKEELKAAHEKMKAKHAEHKAEKDQAAQK